MFQISVDELSTLDIVFQIGVAPQRIDVMTSVSGIEFDDAWPHRLVADLDGVRADVIGREPLLRNKLASGRPKDILNVEILRSNQYLSPSLRLPNTATDVTVYVDFGEAESEFSISEDAFLAWCKSRGWPTWPTKRIVAPTMYFDAMWLPADSQMVTTGYTFPLANGSGGFDATRFRACFWISTFP